MVILDFLESAVILVLEFQVILVFLVTLVNQFQVHLESAVGLECLVFQAFQAVGYQVILVGQEVDRRQEAQVVAALRKRISLFSGFHTLLAGIILLDGSGCIGIGLVNILLQGTFALFFLQFHALYRQLVAQVVGFGLAIIEDGNIQRNTEVLAEVIADLGTERGYILGK